jgi:hypothetical protein
VDHWTLGVIVTRQRIESIDFKLILTSMNWAVIQPGEGRNRRRAADAPNVDMPAAAPFQALPPRRSNGGSGGKRGIAVSV